MTTMFSRPTRLAAAVALPLMFAAAMPLADGLTYDFISKSQSTRTGNKETVTMSGRGMYAGDQARIEIVEAGAGGTEIFGGKGSYFIAKGGKGMFLVDPGKKQYMAWDIAGMIAGMGKMVHAVGGMVKMQMSDIKVDVHDLGAGESVQGYPTHHVRMTQSYTITASVFGRSSKTTNETTTDFYFAPSLKIANPFVSNSQQMGMISQMDTFNNPDFKTQVMAAQAKMPKNGVPLRTVSTIVSTDSKGKQETTISTTEMVNIKPANIPSSAFAIPSDYKLVEMPGMNMAAGERGNGKDASGPALNADSVAAAAKAGAADAAKQEAKNAAKDAASKKIRGIFKH